MGKNMLDSYIQHSRMPGNVGYYVNGQTYREDGSVTNAFDLTGAGADVQHSKKLGGYIPENNATTEGVLEQYGIKNIENKYEVINKVANKLKESYLSTEELRKPITNIDTGMDIEIWKNGINETFGNDEYFSNLPVEDRLNKIAVMPYLANMIKYGEVRAPEARNDHNLNSKVTYAYLESQINVDGNPYTVNMDIRKSPNGENRFYIHSLNVKKGDNHLAHNVEQSKDGQAPFYNNTTTNEGKSQEEIVYSDGEVKNTPFADAFEGIDTDSIFNNGGNDTQKAMPVLNSNAEADVGAEGIIAPKEMIAQIPKANRVMMNVWSKRSGSKILVAGTKSALGQESAGAYSRSKDTIVIDWKTAMDSEAFARKILTHEGVHSVESSEFYNELRDYAFNNLYANEEAKNKAIADKIKAYGDEGVTLDDVGAEKELVADYISEHILSSEKAINSFCRQSPSLAKNVYLSLKKAYAYLTDEEKFEEIKNIEKGLEIFEKALDTRAMGESGEGVQFDIRKDNRGTYYWQIETDKDIFKGIKDNKELLQERAYNYLLSDNKKFVIDGVVDGEDLKFVRVSANKYVYGDHTDLLNDDNYNRKMRLAPSVYDLMENATNKWDAPNHKNEKKFTKHGFKNYGGIVRIDNVAFDYLVRVGKGTDGKYFYDINLEVNDTIEVPRTTKDASLQLSLTSNKKIPQNSADVKSDIQFSVPIASADIDAETDIKIKSNKAKSYYERYSNTAKKDIGKLLGIPRARLGVIDGNIDTLAGEYFHTGKISDASKDALFEKAWKEGVIIDDSELYFESKIKMGEFIINSPVKGRSTTKR